MINTSIANKKNYKIFIVIIIICITYLAARNIYIQQTRSNEIVVSTPTPFATGASYNSITPGVSTEEDLIKTVGKPSETYTSNGTTINLYDLKDDLRKNKIFLKDNKVTNLVRMINSDTEANTDSVVQIYGLPEYTLYKNQTNSSFNLYTYPTRGIAYIGHEDGTILEIWYFLPTTLENFKSLYASEYIDKPAPKGQ